MNIQVKLIICIIGIFKEKIKVRIVEIISQENKNNLVLNWQHRFMYLPTAQHRKQKMITLIFSKLKLE